MVVFVVVVVMAVRVVIIGILDILGEATEKMKMGLPTTLCDNRPFLEELTEWRGAVLLAASN